MSEHRRAGSEVLRIALPLIVLVVGIAGFIGLSKLKGEPADAEVKVKEQIVETTAVRAQIGGFDIRVSGVAVPYREIPLPAEVAGQIEWKNPNCRAGHYVKQGEKLFQIESADYQYEVDRLLKDQEQAAASLDEVIQQIAGNTVLLGFAEEQRISQEQELARQVAAKGVVTNSQIDKTKRDLLIARNAESTLSNELKVLEVRQRRLLSAAELVAVQLVKARRDLDRTTITAPISGVIYDDLVEQDEYVQMGTTLVILDDTSKVEVKCSLRKEDEQWLRLSQLDGGLGDDPTDDYEIPNVPAAVLYELGGAQYVWQGTLDRYDGLGVDERTRMIPCRVVVDKPRDVQKVRTGGGSTLQTKGPRALVRGMYVTVLLHAEPRGLQLLAVPRDSIRPNNASGGSDDVIWLVRGGKLVKQEVQVAHRSEKFAVVLAPGASANDRVATSPVDYSYDGLPVVERRDDVRAAEAPAR